jgi:hypothetical protein
MTERQLANSYNQTLRTEKILSYKFQKELPPGTRLALNLRESGKEPPGKNPALVADAKVAVTPRLKKKKDVKVVTVNLGK